MTLLLILLCGFVALGLLAVVAIWWSFKDIKESSDFDEGMR